MDGDGPGQLKPWSLLAPLTPWMHKTWSLGTRIPWSHGPDDGWVGWGSRGYICRSCSSSARSDKYEAHTLLSVRGYIKFISAG